MEINKKLKFLSVRMKDLRDLLSLSKKMEIV